MTHTIRRLAEDYETLNSSTVSLKREFAMRELARLERRRDKLEDRQLDVDIQIRVKRSTLGDQDESEDETLRTLASEHDVISELLEKTIDNYRQQQEQIFEFQAKSFDLETREKELNNLSQVTDMIRTDLASRELSLAAPPRVEKIQSAMVFRLDEADE